MEPYSIDAKSQKIVYLLLLFAFEITTMYVLYSNVERQFVLSVILGIYICATVFRHFFMHVALIKYTFPIIEVVLIFLVISLDMTTRSQFLFTIIVADIIVGYVFKYSIPFSVVGYLVYLAINIMKEQNFDPDNLIQYVLVSFVGFALILVALIVSKQQLMQNIKYKQVMRQLIEKTNEVEALAIYKERSRIAGEIHDTVGHTLTTVLVELEAGRLLIDKNPELAKEKLVIAKSQVKKGLKDIRHSVKNIKSGDQILEFVPSLRALCRELEQSAAVVVDLEVQMTSVLLPIQEKIIYFAIQETLTNGLKHGDSARFSIQIAEQAGIIQIDIGDQGKGTDHIVEGFGLTNMKERIESIGGRVTFSSRLQEGFLTQIRIPIGQGDAGNE